MTTTKKLILAGAAVAGFVIWRRMRAGATFTQAIGVDSIPTDVTASTATPDPTRATKLRQFVPSPTGTTDATRAMGF